MRSAALYDRSVILAVPVSWDVAGERAFVILSTEWLEHHAGATTVIVMEPS